MALKKTAADQATDAIAGTIARGQRDVEDIISRVPAAKKAMDAEPDLKKAVNLFRQAARLVAHEGQEGLVPEDEK